MSVSQKFKDFIDNLKIENRDTISDRYKNITKRLNKDFWDSESQILHSLYLGSYGRGTAIKRISDIDMAFILPYSVYEKYDDYKSNGQSALLQEVKDSILKTYSTTEVGGDGQVVVVEFTDMIFEVLPCFENEDDSFTYPDSNNGGSWETCNPRAEIEAINDYASEYGNKVKDLAKMARSWREENNVPISGILIDTLVMNFIKGWQYNDKSYLYYDLMTRDFMEYLSEQEDKQYWLAKGSNRKVERTGNFEAKAKKAYNKAKEAIEYEEKSMEYRANECWKEIYGSNFKG